jgi:hypothetical protein
MRASEETELTVFRNVQSGREAMRQQAQRSTGSSTFMSKLGCNARTTAATSESYLNFMQSRLDGALVLKSSSEEDKYVYLLRRVGEYAPATPRLLLTPFLGHLKRLLLVYGGGVFTREYETRIARLLCFVCKATHRPFFLRTLIYDLIMLHASFSSSTSSSSRIMHFSSLVLLCVRIWPDLLNWPFVFNRRRRRRRGRRNELDEVDEEEEEEEDDEHYDDGEMNYGYEEMMEESDSFEMAIKKNPVLCVVVFIVKRAVAAAAADSASSRLDMPAYHNYVTFSFLPHFLNSVYFLKIPYTVRVITLSHTSDDVI